MDIKTKQALETIIDHYGKTAQLTKVIEEMSELTKELAKEINGEGNIAHLAEEIADVYVMLEQLIIIVDISIGLIDDIAREKITRTLNRINAEKKIKEMKA